MKKNVIQPFILLMLQWLVFASEVNAQCSRDALAAKYWQYRENFNKHFILTDRRDGDCVGDGIHYESGVHPASVDSTTLEHCGHRFLNGYSLPATSINLEPNGGGEGMGDRNKSNSIFFDPDCNISGPSPGHSYQNFATHNYLEMGEETPHQMQWYWTTLATEYALLIRSQQLEEAQRTLEELYLGLQAYRRMDMLANCMAEERYQEITDDFEVEKSCNGYDCLCSAEYFSEPLAHNPTFIAPTMDNCPFQADLSGYTGFSLREDATQVLELLHDDSEDKWNIDVVGGDHAMSQRPPCTNPISQACYNVKGKNFLSSDQMYALMQGLVMIKKYIPANATITRCDGVQENILDIAQSIGRGLVDAACNEHRTINWPGSEDCCWGPVRISPVAGGNLAWNYAGLVLMYNYISDDDRTITKKDQIFYNGLGNLFFTSIGIIQPREGKFYLEGISFGMDIGDLPPNRILLNNLWSGLVGTLIPDIDPVPKDIVISNLSRQKVEIYGLINNLLFPGGDNVPVDKQFFLDMLCTAPCSGPCQKASRYETDKAAGLLVPAPDGPVIYPEFECPNTPHWTGQRWEGEGGDLDWENIWQTRQFNGLDFMALYNIFLLHFPEERPIYYYNPSRPEPQYGGYLPGEDKISGPITLCPGESGNYTLNYPNPKPAVKWDHSQHLTLSSLTTDPTTATMVTGGAAYIGVSYQETQQNAAHYNGEPIADSFLVATCDFYYRKPIINELPEYELVTEIDFCQWIYKAIAQGPEFVRETTLSWEATDSNTGLTLTGQGTSFDFASIIPQTPNLFGIVSLRLTVENNCGTEVFTLESPYFVCPNGPPGGNTQGRQILVSPNPTNDQIAIRILQNQTQDFYTTDPNGGRIRIYPGNGNMTTLLDAQMYNNGQLFNVGYLPTGNYHVRATASDLTPIQTNLIIIH
ncbi:MAG TPA: hypothetical protein DCF33_12460 [Saprospirales bacterium]|nr:hypothetical protein [Saprospirales bacterium]